MDNNLLYEVISGLLLLALVLYGLSRNARQKRERIVAARRAYQESLAELKRNPTNAELRQRTLGIGRRYAQIAREGGQDTFDEVALLNDMTAVAGSEVTMSDHKTPILNDDISARLKKLQELKVQGLITDGEYAKRRSAILDTV